MEKSFWNNNHVLTPLADRLTADFIPAMGATKFQETEVFRAALRLHHDYFNNGFGNNMSQAVAYVETYYLDQNASAKFRAAFAAIREMALDPGGNRDLTVEFDIVMSEIVLWLWGVTDYATPTPLVKEMFDMPYEELPENNFMYEDEEEYED